ncbi:MAG: histidinol-phosphate aminotransferase [Pelagibacterium sp. SCN 63-23]|nr:MAG: histidinol-phosphate aminotransferase [Pelagibacterium sp. SCN 63-23]
MCPGFVSKVAAVPFPPFTALVDTLPDTVPFIGPEALERRTGVPVRARIGANESGFGPSPRVIAALADSSAGIWRYPDPENHELRAALAAHLGIGFDEVVIGEGIDGLMSLLVRLFIAPGDVVVTSLGGYPTFNFHVTGFGGALDYVPYTGSHEDLDGLAQRARQTNARMVYLANPDNPMGTHWPATAVTGFAASLPETCLLVLDEAYGETAPASTLPPIDTALPNVLRLRTFSKAYGLAGLRCGYAFGNARLVRAFDRVRNHFGVNRLAQTAALAALGDADHLQWAVDAIAASRSRIATIAAENWLATVPSATNFVAVDCGRDGAYANAVLSQLGKRGVFVRKPMAPGLDRHIRISAAPEAELDILAEALPQALRDAYSSP